MGINTLGDIQDIVDDGQQAVCQIMDNIQHLALVLGEIGIQSQLCLVKCISQPQLNRHDGDYLYHSDDTVHRSTDLV